MMTVHKVSELAGVSIRTLQYYDQIGLLHPTDYTEAGYRLYGEADLERLQQILLFRELKFPLKEIKKIIENPGFDRNKALEQQITLLTLKKERLERLIDLAREIKLTGGNTMDFKAFDTEKLDEYAARAKAAWGDTAAYREFLEKSEGRTKEQELGLSEQMMSIFRKFGKIKDTDPASETAQDLTGQLKAFITGNFYHCTDEILLELGRMYASGGEFTENIDRAGGAGTAEFVKRAAFLYCKEAESCGKSDRTK